MTWLRFPLKVLLERYSDLCKSTFDPQNAKPTQFTYQSKAIIEPTLLANQIIQLTLTCSCCHKHRCLGWSTCRATCPCWTRTDRGWRDNRLRHDKCWPWSTWKVVKIPLTWDEQAKQASFTAQWKFNHVTKKFRCKEMKAIINWNWNI